MFKIGKFEFNSRLFLGTGKYDTEEMQTKAIKASETEVLTFAVRRMSLYDKDLPNPLANVDLDKFITFPNTAGAKSADEAVRIAELANEAGLCDMIKVEVIGDDDTLLPDPLETYRACEILLEKGYTVCPYISNDLVLAKRLQDLGVHAIMPLASPIGTGRGINNPLNLRYIIEKMDVPVIVDAGIGSSKDCAEAMELGADAILLNSAVARAKDPEKMAEAMKLGIQAGRLSYEAGRIPVKYNAVASSPAEGLGYL
ncbi:thiazole synthase [Staphylococcus massiliensis]|uniref:Thiazole synthase n=1 Tax=Staphylococcus massiliensis S46 TaxID=1229783 RepID=K9ARD7_9STAP|nr:thiazole synthase [Staphylococcus massiliensis]EKU48606.1 thiazole synthase [Staphylococcus massiliensis S46]MCG3400252.1 thiazole synthase [Staphylococcus massiliensis]MCG3401882.1 thiazole synthase [Staphylococcus massiliensis]MCG3413135.1 thiazole synthase [Staphylococcus massiliensis]PNZ98453.1 thiazole synthase [Staphylococcus massiliensis CCUG 55927]